MAEIAEALAQEVSKLELLADGDPVKVVLVHLEHAEHRQLLQAATILCQRFHDTPTPPELDRLKSTVDELLLPCLPPLDALCRTRRAFQASTTLTPLLFRAVALAAQCCGAAVRRARRAAWPLAAAAAGLAELLHEAVLARAELHRPFDAPRIYAWHRHFEQLQGQVREAAESEVTQSLAPVRAKVEHRWRYEQLRHFWQSSCAQKYEAKVPLDELTILLLQAAGAEVSLLNREALMQKLLPQCQGAREMSAEDLDACSAEVRRSGGLKAWVHLVVSGAPPRLTPRGAKTPRQGPKPFLLTAPLPKKGSNGPLTDSIGQGLLKASQRLILGDQVSPNGRDAHGDTALHLAASLDFKHGSLGSLLLSHGAETNALDRHGATPLHKAAAGQSNLAQELVRKGADVGHADRWQCTPLHAAAEHGKADLAELLLKEGAQIAADDWGATPLHRAVARGQLAVVEKLLASRADANASDRRGEGPLHLAAARGDYAVVKLLLQCHGHAGTPNRVGKLPEDCARARGHLDVVTLLEHRKEWAAALS